MTPLRFSRFPFFGDFRAPGPLRADSSENFSTERPVFMASPAPMSSKLGTEDFLLKVWRIPRCSFSRSKNYSVIFVCLYRPHNGNFPIFGRFRAERTSRRVGNLVVSVSNALFSLRNSFSAFIFSRKCIFEKKWKLDFGFF